MSTQKIATPKAVRAVARGMSEEYLHCRDIGHNWRLYYQKPTRGVTERRLFCPSCKTNRTCLINRYGEVIKNSYDYPEGYQFKGLGRIQGRGKSTLRVEAILRQAEIDLSSDFPELANELTAV